MLTCSLTLSDLLQWDFIGDRVMGGVSDGHLHLLPEGVIRFEGVVRPDFGGGFSSVKGKFQCSQPLQNPQMVLKVRGDGKRYSLRLGSSEVAPSIFYSFDFDTLPSEWMVLNAPLADFIPRRRGTVVECKPLESLSINSLGLLIAGKQFGLFSLDIAQVALQGARP